MRRALVALLFVCVAAPALAQSAQPPKKPAAPVARTKPSAQPPVAGGGSSGPSLCVVSAIGHKFNVQTIGLMVFGNALESVDISSWGLDDLVFRKIVAVVGGHFQVHRLTFGKAALAAYEAPQKSIFAGGPLFRDLNKELVDMLKAAAATAPRCDSYLAIMTFSSAYADTNQQLDGIGILNREAGIVSTQFLFAILGAGLYDGKTFEMRASKPVRAGPAFDIGEILTGPGIRGLYRRVDKSWLPSPPQAAAQSTRLRNAVWALIEPALAATVSSVLKPE